MKLRFLSSTALAIAFGATVSAQSVPPDQRTQTTSFFAGHPDDEGGQITFVTGPDNLTQDQQAGFRVLDVAGFGEVYDFCADFFVGESDSATYDVSPGFGSLTSTQETYIRNLFSHALPEFNGLFDAYVAANSGSSGYNPVLAPQYDALQGYAGGLQVALWEIIHDQVSTLSVTDPAGDFEVDPSGNGPGRALLAITYAETFLTNIQDGGSWNSDAGGLVYYYAAGGPDQDRLWVAVPEPSTAILGAFGMAFLLRRRR